MKPPLSKNNISRQRTVNLSQFENKLAAMGYRLIAGCDEVGRGALAGPVMACMLILPVGFTYPGIDDSKKLSAGKRESLNKILTQNAIDYAVTAIDENIIDEINILEATRRAMENAYYALKIKPDYLFIDAMTLSLPIATESIIGGDALSISIASASIIAKVTRDNLMIKLHGKYPEYGFDKNKGYGTKTHIEAIKKYGATPIHRLSFIGKYI